MHDAPARALSRAARRSAPRRRGGALRPLLPLGVGLLMAGCLNLGDGSGCSVELGTEGELGNVEFDFDYGSWPGWTSFAAKNGRTWAVGAREGLTLRDADTNAPLDDLTLVSHDPDIIGFAPMAPGSPGAGPGRAIIEARGPGVGRLEVLKDGKLLDYILLAAARPALMLTVTAQEPQEDATTGWIEDGLGEPGVVLVAGAECLLIAGLADASFERLDGHLEISAHAADAEILELEPLGANFKGSRYLSRFRLRGLQPGTTDVVYRHRGVEDRLAVEVTAAPRLKELQIIVLTAGGTWWNPSYYRSIAVEGDDSPGWIVPRAFNARGWPVHGLRYRFGSEGAELLIRPTDDLQVARFLPDSHGSVHVWVETLDLTPKLRASREHFVEPREEP